jgi:hypothetical protein
MPMGADLTSNMLCISKTYFWKLTASNTVKQQLSPIWPIKLLFAPTFKKVDLLPWEKSLIFNKIFCCYKQYYLLKKRQTLQGPSLLTSSERVHDYVLIVLTEMVPEMSVTFNHLTRPIAQFDFVTFTYRESFKSNNISLRLTQWGGRVELKELPAPRVKFISYCLQKAIRGTHKLAEVILDIRTVIGSFRNSSDQTAKRNVCTLLYWTRFLH